jgi:hypothetical protein
MQLGDLNGRMARLEGGRKNSRKSRMDKDGLGSRYVPALVGIVVRGVGTIIGIRTWMVE